MNRDTPNYENIAKSVKTEMTDFVSYYRSVKKREAERSGAKRMG